MYFGDSGQEDSLGAVIALMLLPSYVPGSNKFIVCLGWKMLKMLSIKIYLQCVLARLICLVNIMAINVLREKKISYMFPMKTFVG